MKPIHTIFYSWQSDSPRETNQNAIRQSLRSASNSIEDEYTDTRVEIDEATRDAPGSPNIPKMIFEKIDMCDVFICDLTTINSLCKDVRPTPNPNVLIELGYAIATIGWDRIILVFNKKYGTFPDDLPFDIDRHRAIPFSVQNKNDNNGKNNLAAILKEAIKKIIDKSPLMPHEKKKLTPEQRKKELDISNLKQALSSIHIPTFDHFIEEAPNRLSRRIFFFKDYFASILDSNTFHVYDQIAFEKLTKLRDNWEKALSYGQHYGPDGTGKYYSYYIPMDVFPNRQSELDFYELERLRLEINENFKDLLQYIRHNYLEIDIEETSNNAFEIYKENFEKD
jgi:hypothetical protein